MGNTPYIIIGSYNLLKETFIRDGDTYKDKYPHSFNEQLRGGMYGIVESNGHLWSTHRKFALSTLRNFGLGKDLMQEKILIEVEDIFRKYDAQLGKEQEIQVVLKNAIANVINQTIFGYRFDETNQEKLEKMKYLVEYQEKAFTTVKASIQAFSPRIGSLLPGKSLDQLLETFKDSFYTFFNAEIENHRKKIDFDSEESQDYAEAYLKEQRKQEARGEFELFSNTQFAKTCLDLWLAGVSTTNTTVNWTICYVLNNPEVLQKMMDEMDQVVGSDRLVTMGDKNNLPYFNAVLNESQRCANIVTINLFHATTRDTVINGYPIKKGTGVIAQISTVMLDEKVFPEPYEFNPERFIDENGKPIKIEQLIPFSIGKRQCPGEGLARMEIFLFVANLFNRYKISTSSEGFPNLEKNSVVEIFAKDLKVILTKRYC